MSSSPRSDQLIKRGRRFVPPSSGWKCPECGKKALIRVKKSYLLEDGILMPELEWLQCQSCKEDFFDTFAMYAIDDFRKRYPRRKSTAKRQEKALAA